MHDKSSTELFQILRHFANTAGSLGPRDQETTCLALAELRKRWFSGHTDDPTNLLTRLQTRLERVENQVRVLGEPTNVLARLERVESDFAAFQRAHAGHSHEIRPFALHTLAPTPDVHAPTPAQIGPSARQVRRTSDHGLLPDGQVDPSLVDRAITDLRQNAENRAWKVIEEWITGAPKKTEHSGSTYDVHTGPVTPGHGNDWDAAIWRQFWNEEKDELDSEVVATKRGTSRLDALAHLSTWCEENMQPSITGKPGHEGVE